MKETHVILRNTISVAADDVFRGPSVRTTSLEAAGLSVEVDDIDHTQVRSLARQSDVLAIAPAMPMKLIAPIPVDVAQPTGEGGVWGISAVGAESSLFTGDGVVVAILDTGIDASHEAFTGVELITQNFTNEPGADQNGHGTHCAGTIFGRSVGGTRIGVAPGVRKALIGKVIGAKGGSSEQIAKAIVWAMDNGADVISMSLGIDFPGLVERLTTVNGMPTALATSRALESYRANVMLFERLASLVRARGAFSRAPIIVAAAGNESQRQVNPDFVIAVSPPAVAEGIISVAALTRASTGLAVAPFSNIGANVSAPGVDILSAKIGGGLVSMSGTSMATPHVAGVAALWTQKIKAVGSLNAFELTNRLVGTAIQSGLRAGWNPVDIGAGLVRAPQE